MTLSSTKVEYVTVSDVYTDIMLIKMIMAFLQLEMKRPVKVQYDNVGAILWETT